MPSIRIVTDSTCDIPPDLAGRWQISVVPCYINFGTDSYLDQVELSRDRFYQELVSNPIQPTTAAPPPGMFAEIYQRVAATATGIVSLHPPDSLSALRQSALNGWDMVKGNIPFRALDAGQLSMGLGWIAIRVAQAAEAGASMNALEELVFRLRERVHLFAALDTVEYLRRSGRVGWARGAIGKLLRIRPLLQLYQGTVASSGYSRTLGSALRTLLSRLQDLAELEELTLLHSNSPDLADKFRELLASLPMPDSIRTVNVTPILGTHVGPGAVGFVAIQRQAS